MNTKQAQSNLETLFRRDRVSSDLESAELDASLRELAYLALGRFRDIGGHCFAADGSQAGLADVPAGIAGDRPNLGPYPLDDLTAYIAALGERAEECLAGTVEDGGTVGLLPRSWSGGNGNLCVD
jgi:hypothetical protein